MSFEEALSVLAVTQLMPTPQIGPWEPFNRIWSPSEKNPSMQSTYLLVISRVIRTTYCKF